MNAFSIAAVALLGGFLPLAWVAMRAKPLDGVAALELAGSVATLILLCLAEGFHRSVYVGVSVVCAALTWISGILFARLLGNV